MDCYTLELVHECHERDGVDPMLHSVPCAYILTMHETETFPWLHGVARRTYVQRNRGFRACFKTQGSTHSPYGPRVDATNQDLIHAYRTVFASALLQSASAPVLVFEDDARLTRTARQDLVHVDRFVATRAFSVYSLGSIGLMVPYDGAFRHWRFVGSLYAFTHATIYSPSAVRAVLDAVVGPRDHVDGKIVGPMPLKVTYARPIAYQVIDAGNRSENSATWCARCEGSEFSLSLDAAMREFAWIYFRVLGLETEGGWYVMYTVHQFFVVLCVCVLCALCAMLTLVVRLR
jgi:hypothetical protein